MCERVLLQDDEQAGVVEVAGHGRDELLHSLSLSLLQTCAKNTHTVRSLARAGTKDRFVPSISSPS